MSRILLHLILPTVLSIDFSHKQSISPRALLSVRGWMCVWRLFVCLFASVGSRHCSSVFAASLAQGTVWVRDTRTSFSLILPLFFAQAEGIFLIITV